MGCSCPRLTALICLWLGAWSAPLGAQAPEPTTAGLRGVVEESGGALRLRLQNLDARRGFSGVARVSVGDGLHPREASAVPVALRPEEELSFALDAAGKGSYTMLIYDERGALRFIQGGTLGPVVARAAPAPPPPSPEPDESEPPSENEVQVALRRTPAGPGNVTLEFEFTSKQPLGQVTMSLRGSAINETRRAVFTGTKATIPFVVPAEWEDPLFTYVLKDAASRSLAVGQMNFRRVAEVKP